MDVEKVNIKLEMLFCCQNKHDWRNWENIREYSGMHFSLYYVFICIYIHFHSIKYFMFVK